MWHKNVQGDAGSCAVKKTMKAASWSAMSIELRSSLHVADSYSKSSVGQGLLGQLLHFLRRKHTCLPADLIVHYVS